MIEKTKVRILAEIAQTKGTVSSRQIELKGCSPLEISVAVNQLIKEQKLDGEYEGVDGQLISYRINGVLPDGDRDVERSRYRGNSSWLKRIFRGGD
ncbi:MAG: hypothetical protein AAF483_20055 [Planctomycetota bacterium]